METDIASGREGLKKAPSISYPDRRLSTTVHSSDSKEARYAKVTPDLTECLPGIPLPLLAPLPASIDRGGEPWNFVVPERG